MNKYILIAAIMLVAKGAKGQDVWEVPTDNSTNNTEMKAAKGNKTENGTTKTSLKNPQYLSGAVTEKDGKVAWELNIGLKGKTAQQIYDATIKTFQSYTKQDNQLEGSKIALVNKTEHIIVAQVKEWLVFKNAFLALDRAKLQYNLVATCMDGKLNVTMGRISYIYDGNDGKGETKILAEEAINDKNGLNKKKTKLTPGWARFRIKTVDRKDEVFNYIKEKTATFLAD